MSNYGWCAVDLDGTLAYYDKWRGSEHVGEPVPAMLNRVQVLLASGTEVKIFTARVSPQAIALNNDTRENVVRPIEAWCLKHIGRILPITHEKDMAMIFLYDDRCKQVTANTGELVEEIAWQAIEERESLRSRVNVLEILGGVLIDHINDLGAPMTDQQWAASKEAFNRG